jgi:S-adenosylmethionine decarboxylase proenzyme
MSPLGRHLLAEFGGCDPSALADLEGVSRAMREAAVAAGATVVTHSFHRFGGGGGISGVVVIAESHLAIHTWPEHAFAAVDLFTCGRVDAERGLDVLRRAFRCARMETLEISRGPLEVLAANPPATGR